MAEPFFWAEQDWISQPEDWAPSTQRGKGYDLRARIGRRLWTQVTDRLRGTIVSEPKPASWLDLPGGYGDPVHVSRAGNLPDRRRRRVRPAVRCNAREGVSGAEAAHIRPFKEEPKHYVRNGLLLRSDVHKLFDAGYVTVTPDYRFEVSDHIHTDFDDGENYYELDETKLWVPKNFEHHPGREHLEWHNENRFRG